MITEPHCAGSSAIARSRAPRANLSNRRLRVLLRGSPRIVVGAGTARVYRIIPARLSWFDGAE